MVTHMPVEAPEQMHPARSMVVDAAIAYPMTDEDVGYSRFFRDQYPRVVRTIHLIVHAWVRRIAIRMTMRGLRRDQLFATLRVHLLPRPAPEPRDLDIAGAVRRLPRAKRCAVALSYDFVLRADVPAMDVVSDSDPGNLIPQTSVFETLPFTRVP